MEKTFGIQRLYIKDLSFEAPKGFRFLKPESRLEISYDLKTEHFPLESDHFEISLKLSVKAKQENEIVFIVEVDQAGSFVLSGFDSEELDRVVYIDCMYILFPYAREILSEMVMRGGFQPLYLPPVHFESLYQERLKEKAKETK